MMQTLGFQPMIERKLLRFPSVLFQILDVYCDPGENPLKFKQILNYLSVSEANLRDPEYYFDGEQFYLMLDLLRRNTDSQPPSIRILQELSITHFGMAGIAGLTANTLNDAFETVLKFYKFFMPAVTFRLEKNHKLQKLELELCADYDNCNTILVELILGTLKQFADEATGETLPVNIQLEHSARWDNCPVKTKSRYQEYFKCEVEFDAQVSSLVFDGELLRKRLRSQNQIVNSMAMNIIDREFQYCATPPSLTEQVNTLLRDALDKEAPVSLELLASQLHMSSRTLSRKLAKENINYKVLVNNIRFERAKSLLKQTELPNKQLAAKLGFSNPDGFSRAFKAYTGITPSEWKTKRG